MNIIKIVCKIFFTVVLVDILRIPEAHCSLPQIPPRFETETSRLQLTGRKPRHRRYVFEREFSEFKLHPKRRRKSCRKHCVEWHFIP